MAARLPRRTYFWILPVAVFGNSSTNVTECGALKCARRSRVNCRSSSDVAVRRASGSRTRVELRPISRLAGLQRGLLDRRMAQQHAFDFYRRDVLTTADDHVLMRSRNLGVTSGWTTAPSPEWNSRRAWLSPWLRDRC